MLDKFTGPADLISDQTHHPELPHGFREMFSGTEHQARCEIAYLREKYGNRQSIEDPGGAKFILIRRGIAPPYMWYVASTRHDASFTSIDLDAWRSFPYTFINGEWVKDQAFTPSPSIPSKRVIPHHRASPSAKGSR